MWDTLCVTIGQPELADDPRFATDQQRRDNSPELRAIIQEWTLLHTKWEVMQILGEAGVPCSANFDTYDLFHDQHLNERGFVHTLDHPAHGEIKLLGWAPRMSASDVSIKRAPLMGEHCDEVLRGDLALDEEEIAELRDAGIVA